MKKLSIVLLALIISGCGSVAHISLGVTSEAYTKALNACGYHNGVSMVNQSEPAKYTAYCNDGYMTVLK